MTNRGKRWHSGVSGIAITVAAGALVCSAPAFAQVTGGQVVGGQATIAGQGTSQTTITQTSDRAILNWDRFSLGAGDVAVFQQPDARSITVNRVIGSDPSAIMGSIKANGQVVLINRNGVLFGKGSTVDTAGLIVSTHDIDATGFLRGDSLLRFTDGGNDKAEVVVEGRITIRDAGMAAFVAPHVRNSGLIQADMGRVTLAAGKGFGIDLYGDGLVRFAASDAITGTLNDAQGQPVKALVENDGTIAARGGKILLTATAAREVVNASVNVAGIVRADSVSSQGGVITLSGPGGITTETGSVITAAGATGGSVAIAGGAVGLGGTIDASSTGARQTGGTVAIKSDSLLSLGGAVLATSALGSGGSVSYEAARLFENSDGQTNVSGLIDGGTIRSIIRDGAMTSGRYAADGLYGVGGRIDMTATDLRLLSATVAATGRGGGGLVRLGGPFQGGKAANRSQPYHESFLGRWGDLPALATAGHAFVNDGTTIDVHAAKGQGGTAIVWSDAQTTFMGAIDARGSGAKGSGGAVELSSAQDLRRADLGRVAVGDGHLLLDPKNIIIGDSNSLQSWAYQGIIGKWYTLPGIAQLEANDLFGVSVALNSAATKLAVGASGDAGAFNTAASAGAVYLFSFSDSTFGGGFLQGIIGKGYSGGTNYDVTKLAAGNQFGMSVALNGVGDTLAVGAIGDKGASGTDEHGAVYLFRLDAAGPFLRAIYGSGYSGAAGGAAASLDYGSESNTTANGLPYFGRSVALNYSGDRLAIGANRSDGFGHDTATVGAVYIVDSLATGAGATGAGVKAGAISYSAAGSSGTNISISNLETNDQFGQSVAFDQSGYRLAVGAWEDRGFANKRAAGTTGARTGAVYLIDLSFPGASTFTASVEAIIGAGYTGGKNIDLGASAATPYAHPIKPGDALGAGVALSRTGGQLFVGASNASGAAGLTAASGAVYMFEFPSAGSNGAMFGAGSAKGVLGKGYSAGKSLDVTSTRANSFFGISLATNGDGTRLAVGTLEGGKLNDATFSGGVHLFTFKDYASAGNTQAFDNATELSIFGKGYYTGTNLDIGSTLDAGDNLGYSVALNADATRMAVGAIGDAGAANDQVWTGAVYLFSFVDANFNGGALQGIIGRGYTGGKNVNVAALQTGDDFGTGVALNAAGDRLAVGALGDDGAGISPGTANNDYGAVYLFSFSDTNFSGGSLKATIGKGYTGSGYTGSTASDRDIATLRTGEQFGRSVSLNAQGNLLAAGAPLNKGADGSGTGLGAVYLFGFTSTNGVTDFSGGTNWSIVGKGYSGANDVNVSTLGSKYKLGFSVALNAAGDRLAAGAIGDNGQGRTSGDYGAAYLYSFDNSVGTNLFASGALTAKLGLDYVPTSSTPNDVNVGGLHSNGYFGSAIALNAAGDRLAVGAMNSNGVDGGNQILPGSGKVYLFNFLDGNFAGGALQATLGKGAFGGKNVNVGGLDALDAFGSAVALNAAGDRLAVGALNDSGGGNVATNSGAAYLFTFADRNFSGGTLAGTIGKGNNGKNVDIGGYLDARDLSSAVTMNAAATLMAVGSPLDAGFNNATSASGAVYLFSFSDTNFGGGTLKAILGKGYSGAKNVDVAALESFDFFGQSVSLNGAGDRLAVGASGDDGAGVNYSTDKSSGAVYLFSFSDTSFTGGTLKAVIGRGYTGVSTDYAGARASDYNLSSLRDKSGVGEAVSLNATGDLLAVGSSLDSGSDGLGTSLGAVYLFAFDVTNGVTDFTGAKRWATLGKGYASASNVNNVDIATLRNGDQFGSAVSFNAAGDRLAIGAFGDDGQGLNMADAGAVYLYSFDNTSRANLFRNATLSGKLGYGYAPTASTANDRGITDLASGDLFGRAVSLNASATRLAIGAWTADGVDSTGNTIADSGAVYVIDFADGNFSGGKLSTEMRKGVSNAFVQDLAALDAGDKFGRSVALNAAGDRMAVGASRDDGAGNASTDSGAVYLFSATNFSQLGQLYANAPAATAYLKASDIAAQLATGTAVTLQASNDITVNSPITVSGTPSSVGALTLQAGRSILLNGSITTKGGNVSLIANDLDSYGVIPAQRDAGRAVVTMAAGTAIDAGAAGNVGIAMSSGVSSSNLLGDITLTSITGKSILVSSLINYSGNAIILSSGGQLKAYDTGFAIDLLGEKLTNNAGASALSAPNGYWQVWTDSPTGDYVNGLPFDFKTYNATLNLIQDAGKNGLLYMRAPTLTATLGAVTKTYDGTTAATLPAGAVTCTVCAFAGDAVTGYGADTITGYTSTTGTFNSKDVGAGNKTVTFRKAGVAITATSNGKPVYGYRLSSNLQNTGSTIATAPLSVTATAASKTYDGTAWSGGNGVTYAGFVNGETDAVLGGTLGYAGTAQGATNAGSYAITPNGLTSSNYAITFVDGALTVNKAALALTYTANAATSVYGATPATLGGTVTGTGFVTGETVADLGTAVWTTPVTAASAVGTYGISGSGLASSNYAITASQAAANSSAYTVTKATLTVIGNTATHAYDTTAQINGFTTTGLVNGDTVTAVSGLASGTNAGTYADSLSGATGTGLSNYTIGYTNGALTISPLALTLLYTADAATSTYGAPTATLSGTVTGSGFATGETVANLGTAVWTTPVIPTSAVGTYGISGSGLASGNYTITASQASANSTAYSVTKAALTITANAASKTYDGLAYSGGNGVTYTGLVNNETASVLGGTLSYGGTAQGAKNAGSYLITPKGLTASNYAVTFVDGALTVNKKPLTLTYTAFATGSNYGAPQATLAGPVSGTGFVPGEALGNLGGTTSWTTPVTATTPVGSYAITGYGWTSSNYAITEVQASTNSTAYTVRAAPLTVAANNATKVYDGLPYSGGNGVTYSGFVNGEDTSVIGGTLAYGGTSQNATTVGSYKITPKGLTASNYRFVYTDGTLSITPAPLELTYTANAATSVYGARIASVSGVVTGRGFVNNETTSNLPYLGTWTTRVTSSSVVGGYAISGAGAFSNNYTITEVQAAGNNTAYNVTPAPLTITANNDAKPYTGFAYSGGNGVTYSGFVGWDDASRLTGRLTYGGTSQGAVNAGSYTITPGGLTSPNYTIAFLDGTLTVGKAALTLLYTANTAFSTYGNAPASMSGSVTGTGFVRGDTVASLSGTATWTTPVTSASPAGSYSISGSGLTSDNYTLTVNQAPANSTAYTVNRAPLTVTANAASKIYDGLLYSGGNGVSYAGFVNGDTSAVLGGTLSYGGRAQGAKDVGSYTITPAGLTASNYAITYADGALTVTPKALTLVYTAAPASSVYGAPIVAASGSVSGTGFVNNEGLADLGGSATWTPSASATSNVGAYGITGAGVTSTNYTITAQQAAGNASAYTIDPKALTITGNTATLTYDGTAQTNGFTTSGLVNGDTVTAVSGLGTGTNAATYADSLSGATGTGLSNYTIGYANGALTIAPRALTLLYTATPASSPYGTAPASVTGTVSGSGFAQGEGVANLGGSAVWTTPVTSASPSGRYAIDGAGLTSGNYTITAQQAAGNATAYTVTKGVLTITGNTVSLAYNGTPQSNTGFTTTGLSSGDSVTAVTGLASGTNAGSYTDNLTAASGVGLSNYTIAFVNGGLTITPLALTLVYNATAASSIYGSAAASVTGSVTGTGFAPGEDVTNLGGAAVWTTPVTSTSTVGRYGIDGAGLTSANYTITAQQAGGNATAYTVDPKALTVIGNAATATYSGRAQSNTGFTTSGLVNGDTVTAVSGLASGTNAGTYADSLSGATGTGLSNYTIGYTNGALTIDKKALVLEYTAAAASSVYGSAPASVTGSVSSNDFVNNETLADLGGSAVWTTSVTPTSGVGHYAIDGAGLTSANYTITAQQAAGNATAYTVDPKALTITGGTTTLLYSGTAQSNGFTANGLINGDTVTAVSGLASGTNAGSYTDSLSGPTGTGLANYTITLVDGGLTIAPRALTLVYDAAAASSVYGSAAASVTGRVTGTGFAPGEDVTNLGGAAVWTTPVTTTTAVGRYGIDGAGLTSANYTITAQQAGGNATAYTVDPKALTVIGNAATATYSGRAQSNTGFTTSGLVNGDTVTAVSGLGTGTNAGTYADNLSGATGTGLSNYTIGYTNGALTIDKKALVLEYTAAAASSVYGSAPASVTGSVSSNDFVNNETLADLGGSAVWTTSVTPTSGVGRYAIDGAGLTSGNYAITAQQAVGNATAYTVDPKALTITATAASKTYDGRSWSGGNGVSYLGLVNGETAAVLGGTLGYGGSAQGAVNAGSYVITPNGLTASNYAITFADGALVVGKAALTVTAKDASRTYDGQSWSGGNGVDYNGFVNHETEAVLGGALSYAGSAQGAVRAGRYGIDVNGLTSNNYAFTYVGGHLVVDPRAVALTGRLTATSKVYDAGVVATVDTTGLRLSNTVANDDVQLNLGGATGTFADRNVGTGKTVTLSTAGALTGRDAGNYTFITTAAPTATADITPATLAVSGVTAASRTYDATRVARLSGGSVTALGSDAVSLSTSAASGTFADKNVGIGKAVTASGYTISGVDAGNYTLEQPTGLTADVIKASLSVTGVSAASRIYDATTAASLSGGSVTALGSDTVSLSTTGASGTFADKHVGNGKTVTATGYTISGTDAGNYTLLQPVGLAASITPANLAVTGVSAANRVYDATTAASLSGGSVTALRGDTVSLSTLGASGTFADKNVGSGKAVTATGYTISGKDAGNYTLVQPVGLTADVTRADLAVTGVRAANRGYDATTAASLSGGSVSALGSDSVSLSTSAASGTFADKNVGSGKAVAATGYAISGVDAGNYTLVQPAGLTATITPMALSVAGVTVADKVYDATTAATVSGGSVTALAGDVVTLVTSSASGAFADKNAGARKAVDVSGFALSGADAGNYTLLQPIGVAAAIDARTLSVAGSFSAQSKVYDATTNATVDARGLNLLNAIAGDDLRLNLQGASGTFADKNVGSNKVVTLSLAGSLAGVDAANYRLATATASSTAAISPASLAVTGVATINKIYDATDVVGLTGGSVQALGRDAVSLVTAGASGRMNDKNVGTAKAVTATGYALSGADAGNYAIVQPVGLTVDVARAGLMVRDMTITKKTYDATAGATVAGGSVQPLGGDDVRLNTSTVNARFADKNAGSGKAVRVSGLTLTGTDALNYEVLAPTNLLGEIEPARLAVVGAGAQGRAYDASTVVGVSGGSVTPLGSDIVLLNATHAVGALADKNAGAGKTVTVSGFTLSGADAANYTVVQPGGMTVDITPASLSISGIAAVGKVYDGSTSVALTGGMVTALGPDIVALVTTGATANFDSKNVGANKAVTVSGYALTGPDAGNYSLVQPTGLTTSVTRLASVTWTGKGDGKNWFDPANWAGGAIPDGSNVADVVLPAATKLTFDSTQQVSIDRLVTSPDADTVPSGTDTVLDLLRGNLVVDKDLTIDTLVQRGGGLTGAGSVTVLDSFTQTGGSIVMKGDVSVYQGSGDLETLSVSGRDITLTGTQAVRVRDTNASRDLTIVAGGDAVLGGPTKVGRNLSVTAGQSGTGAITQDQYVTVSGDAVLKSVGDITLSNTGNHFAGTVSCTSTSGKIAGSCTSGGAIDQLRGLADKVVGRAATVGAVSAGRLSTSTGTGNLIAGGLVTGSAATADVLSSAAPAYEAPVKVETGHANTGAADVLSTAPVGVTSNDGAGRMLADTDAMAKADTTYVTARFDEKDDGAAYHRVLPRTNLGDDVYYVGN